MSCGVPPLAKHPRMPDPLSTRYRVGTDAKLTLADIDPDGPSKVDRPAIERATVGDLKRIDELQEVFYADGRHAILVVLQAMDTGGKDSTVRKVFGDIDPLGIKATSFKRPTPDELAHDFLWRAHRAVPAKGEIGIFNRSHYEDVLVTRVHGLVDAETCARRYRQINDFEHHLGENGTVVLKFFLHISKDEQRDRLRDRIEDPTKHWKFNPGDLDERARWDDYQSAYEAALRACSTANAPWYVVPANRKWVRNHIVAQVVRQTLEKLGLRYPPAMPGIAKLSIPD